MPSLKAIRNRIGSVKNTRKITRAMKLVAAAKLRRAQDAITAARPYCQGMEKVVTELAHRAGNDAHPLLEERGTRRASLVLLTSDRGLAGSFNAQIIRRAESFIADDLADIDEVCFRIVGKKGHEHFKRRQADIRGFDPAPQSAGAIEWARATANHVVADFLDDDSDVDRVYLIYNEFKSAISTQVTVEQLLPIKAVPVAEAPTGDFLYEPSQKEVLDHLLPLYVETQLLRAGLESAASELGSRMSAMDSATRNAGEMIEKLSLQYNRARQAAITKELLEIIAGAESLNG
ncbi:MAG TPA: ATP synthase F1 subunit gamma [Kofleriaceae bacterium]|nr:ATP synthase F1 subunit gamma [Kofleriaceae bacterium]